MVQVQQLSERREVLDAAAVALGGIGAVLWQAGGGALGPPFRALPAWMWVQGGFEGEVWAAGYGDAADGLVGG